MARRSATGRILKRVKAGLPASDSTALHVSGATSQLSTLTADASPASTALFLFEKATGELRKLTRTELSSVLGSAGSSWTDVTVVDVTNWTLDLSSPPAGTKNVEFESYLRVDEAVTDQALKVEFNGDTTATNYDFQQIEGANGAAGAGELASRTATFLGRNTPARPRRLAHLRTSTVSFRASRMPSRRSSCGFQRPGSKRTPASTPTLAF